MLRVLLLVPQRSSLPAGPIPFWLSPTASFLSGQAMGCLPGWMQHTGTPVPRGGRTVHAHAVFQPRPQELQRVAETLLPSGSAFPRVLPLLQDSPSLTYRPGLLPQRRCCCCSSLPC